MQLSVAPFLTSPSLVLCRAPAISVAAAFCAGIVADRFTNPPYEAWLIACGALAAAWIAALASGRPGWAAACLLGALLALGGARHAAIWSAVPAQDITAFARETPQPVRLRGLIETQPFVVPRPSSSILSVVPQTDRTICQLRARELIELDRTFLVDGRIRLEIAGRPDRLDAGDEVEVYGHLVRPSPAQNPGGFDFRQYLRNFGIHTIVRAELPEAVTVTGQARGFWFTRWRADWQQSCEAALRERLAPETAPLAVALLLGPRSEIPDDVRDAFMVSGTVHLLAISGINVGILMMFLWGCGRLVGASSRQLLLIMAIGVIGYACLTDARSSVLRATVMALVWLLGRGLYRHTESLQICAVAAIAVLLINPCELFQPGAQLSFLGVLGLIWAARYLTHWSSLRDLVLGSDPLVREFASPWLKGVSTIARWIGEGYFTSLAVGLFTLPVTVAHFQLVSVIGLMINLPLVPLLTVTLWSGYALLLCSAVLPDAAWVFAIPCDAGLRLLLVSVDWAAGVAGGHFHVSSPVGWWLAVFYAGLALLVIAPMRGLLQRVMLRGLWIWILLGLVVPLTRPRSDILRCTFLAVGHGGAILLELPEGGTILYDAGSSLDGRRTAETIHAVLRARGLSRLDLLLLSHADLDHFNAVPALARKAPIGMACISPTFLDFDQPSVPFTCDALAAAGVPIRLIGTGDQLQGGPGVRLEILHPFPGPPKAPDNAQSLVLAVTYAGRRILLTGDLEGSGLPALYEQPAVGYDVLQAPHHGSLSANTPDLARWARPGHVIVSSSRRDSVSRLHDIYGPETTLYSTPIHGAITVTITPDGKLTCMPFRDAVLEESDR